MKVDIRVSQNTLLSQFNLLPSFSHAIDMWDAPCKISGLKIEFERSPQNLIFYIVNLHCKNFKKIKIRIFFKKCYKTHSFVLICYVLIKTSLLIPILSYIMPYKCISKVAHMSILTYFGDIGHPIYKLIYDNMGIKSLVLIST